MNIDQVGILPESMCGLMEDRGGMNFTDTYLQVKCQEQNLDLFYMTFVDHTKAFDTICCDRLWKKKTKFGSPNRFIAMVQQFHDGMQARVQNDEEYSDFR